MAAHVGAGQACRPIHTASPGPDQAQVSPGLKAQVTAGLAHVSALLAIYVSDPSNLLYYVCFNLTLFYVILCYLKLFLV